ncbi:NAD-dependent succinate-semialdehyde dehydrogenase [Pseudanabaena mucicola]|uniref:NAD-dependent succinate-semialdehyde dehydrogenase n=1 Tax=Pseudanabaena mucicola FACHB-723 TaxID=2692860 RepID=A0ABR7ZZD3_9CYAN|nr:NAD-dependent succinate-semialdehyde dehydrogenase [Pseudanabaena mucicola]MBD2188850.1 NAD-dependent succinate-semialdehyde dehydrogenase [Pseudanabaena mucicola FACHB-723]
MAIASINPVTGELLKTFTPLSDAEIEQKIALADHTFATYKHSKFADRSRWMHQAADILEAKKTELAIIITLEMGKTLKSAIAEIEKCAHLCRFYAEHAPQFLADTPATTDASCTIIRYQPLGAILAVMPWNFPFWQVFRFAVPALMAGNVGLLKHASNVPQCALAIAEVFHAAGIPEGAFQTLLIGADRVANLVADARIKAATLTGSEPAGQSLAAMAGHHLKKVVLELGGSDPFIVLHSADLDLAVSTAVTARIMNNGQTCIAAKRFILEDAIADLFIAKFVEKFKALKVGDPMQPETDVGPLATPQILHKLDAQVKASVDAGAKILIGGYRLKDKGNFYAPTILSDIPLGAPPYQEEFFGPVASIFRVKNIQEAIALANSTNFGLGASIWTQDLEEIELAIEQIESGAVFVNGMVKSDPRVPFGGIKRSGFGRELGCEGIREFVNIKTIWIA